MKKIKTVLIGVLLVLGTGGLLAEDPPGGGFIGFSIGSYQLEGESNQPLSGANNSNPSIGGAMFRIQFGFLEPMERVGAYFNFGLGFGINPDYCADNGSECDQNLFTDDPSRVESITQFNLIAGPRLKLGAIMLVAGLEAAVTIVDTICETDANLSLGPRGELGAFVIPDLVLYAGVSYSPWISNEIETFKLNYINTKSNALHIDVGFRILF